MISGSAHERPDPAGRRAEPLITAGGAPSWSDRATSAPMPRWCGTTTAPWSSALVRQRPHQGGGFKERSQHPSDL